MTLDAVRGWIAASDRVAVLTGAGMSAESGVPTFRDAQTGLWAKFRPEALATEEGFRADPQRVWDWYLQRREAIARVSPNAGHVALADCGRRHPGKFTVVTQNVDGLHQRAGSRGVLALHGTIFDDTWLDAPRACCHAQAPVPGRPPRCPACGNLRRPAVVWFGEMLPLATLEAAEQAAGTCGLLLVIGTSGVVHPAAGLAYTACDAGARVVVVNPHPSELDAIADEVLRGTAATLLPPLLAD